MREKHLFLHTSDDEYKYDEVVYKRRCLCSCDFCVDMYLIMTTTVVLD